MSPLERPRAERPWRLRSYIPDERDERGWLVYRCVECHEPYDHHHGNRYYCSDACKQRAYRHRRALRIAGERATSRIDQGCPVCNAPAGTFCTTPNGTARNDHRRREYVSVAS